jgi:Cys-tRNA(Pro)/Cys-tRNA(Cys) deacylase
MKTNAIRLLDNLGIAYELREYQVGADALEATIVAQRIGLAAEQVFKTLLVEGDRTGYVLTAVPADSELDDKALARLTGDRRIEMVPVKQLQVLTGYIRGGVTALACKRPYPVFADETIILFDRISVSAGVRGMQVLLAPDDYIRAVQATMGAISRR